MKSSPFRPTFSFRWISSKEGNPFWNMALDEAISKEVFADHSPPTLRFYLWDQPSISIGYFQNPSEDLNLSLLEDRKIPWVRRMTGGKGIYHHRELTYSLSIPFSLPSSFFPQDLKGSYQKIGLGFAKGFQRLALPIQLFAKPFSTHGASDLRTKVKGSPLCFSRPSWYETLIEGKKVLGSAQKRFKKGFIQQGTLLLNHRYEEFKLYFNLGADETAEFIGIFDYLNKEMPIADLEKCFIAGFEEELGITFLNGSPSGEEERLATELVERKYGREKWNRIRFIHD